MNKEFIPYEQALALKELGFDEPCFGYYIESGIWMPAPYLKEGHMLPKNTDLLPEWCSAPTFSQAFRWFREKCGYDVHIRGTIFRASYVIGIPKEIYIESADGYPVVVSWDYIIDKTGERKIYEEAELECLNKLIEIVKKNL